MSLDRARQRRAAPVDVEPLDRAGDAVEGRPHLAVAGAPGRRQRPRCSAAGPAPTRAARRVACRRVALRHHRTDPRGQPWSGAAARATLRRLALRPACDAGSHPSASSCACTCPSSYWPTRAENRWANDIDGSALEAQPGKSQGRPLNSPGSTRPSSKPACPADLLRKSPSSQSAEPKPATGQDPDPQGAGFMPRRAGPVRRTRATPASVAEQRSDLRSRSSS